MISFGFPFSESDPVCQSSVVGKRVPEELRDSSHTRASVTRLECETKLWGEWSLSTHWQIVNGSQLNAENNRSLDTFVSFVDITSPDSNGTIADVIQCKVYFKELYTPDLARRLKVATNIPTYAYTWTFDLREYHGLNIFYKNREFVTVVSSGTIRQHWTCEIIHT